jgi:hypothetical protein
MAIGLCNAGIAPTVVAASEIGGLAWYGLMFFTSWSGSAGPGSTNTTRRGEGVEIEEVNNPDDPDRLEETGGLLPNPHAKLAGPTIQQWLESAPQESLQASY